ncbi:hypothetical protein H2201_007567 [Coniosporium apollinis]|uniref:Cobalamin-independent methionine synthase MetE C-terminal/archaeal domain-containing protein n=1 Tax=Coniosporium apollinis TaxID=61459 RepID=A0ABQ9NMV0_9PEZI|nr:hypothetical protein H2201_007567 [Coniosporium apollinis]
MSAPPQQPCGVHMVGSVPLPSAEDVFRQVCEALPGRLRRITDGETGDRSQFCFFQRNVFAHTPTILVNFDGSPPKTPTRAEIEHIVKGMPRIDTGYDEHALSSYSTFRRLRAEGIVPGGIRFQVSLPTPINFVGSQIEPAFRPAVEPLYEEAVLRVLKRIEAETPRQDLAIQWDVAVEFGQLERVLFEPWFEPVKEGIFERLVRLGNAVDEGVEMGFHLCYGDIGHAHFKEPEDTSLLVEVATAILERVKRPVNWIHLPVPKNRDDPAYFAPLEKLKGLLGQTELYLGLVHAEDEEGTRWRIETPSKVLEIFGVATECGMGRTPPAELASILQISAAVSSPIN